MRLRSATKRARETVPYEADPDARADERMAKHMRAYAIKDGVLYAQKGTIIAYEVLSDGGGVKESCINLVNESRKRTVVVDFAEGCAAPEFQEAMRAEVESFYKNDCVKERLLQDVVGNGNLISTRWVLTIKTREDGTKRHKARLVARGFEDDEKRNVSKGSPVASTPSQRLVTQVLVEQQWKITSWDYLSAFLQGQYLSRDSPVILQPPPDFVDDGVVWELKKPVYGLVSAPKAWYDKLCDVVQNCGFDANVSDEGVFRLFDRGDVIGVLALHVDDTLGGGTPEFHRTMDQVSSELLVGSKEEENFHYKGLRYSTVYQKDGTFEVHVDGAEYVDALEFGEESGGPDDERLSPKDAIAYRSCAGCVGYVASSFRPDVAVECSILGRTFMNPTNWDMRKVNNVLKYIKKEQYAMRFRKGAKLLSVFCDSAGPNERGTQGGRVFALTDEKTEEVACWIYWESRKVKRTCRSTNTAEVLAMDEGRDTAMWLQQLWFELTGNTLPIQLLGDSEGTAKNTVTTKLPTEKRLRIDLACMRQGLRRGEYFMTWLPSRSNLSDPLTKESPTSEAARIDVCMNMKRLLLTALRTNNTQLKGVRRITKTQEDVRKY